MAAIMRASVLDMRGRSEELRDDYKLSHGTYECLLLPSDQEQCSGRENSFHSSASEGMGHRFCCVNERGVKEFEVLFPSRVSTRHA
jgi:hypothetical protein